MAEPIREDFAGDERLFLIRIGELRRIQIACGAGVGEIVRRLAQCVNTLRSYPEATLWEQAAIGFGTLHVDDVREPIYEGLVAGGMKAPDASKLVRREIDERGFRGLIENAPLALGIMLAGTAVPEDAAPPGGAAGEGESMAGKTPQAGSTSEPSTEPAASSAPGSARSTKAGSGNSSKGSTAGPKRTSSTRKA